MRRAQRRRAPRRARHGRGAPGRDRRRGGIVAHPRPGGRRRLLGRLPAAGEQRPEQREQLRRRETPKRWSRWGTGSGTRIAASAAPKDYNRCVHHKTAGGATPGYYMETCSGPYPGVCQLGVRPPPPAAPPAPPLVGANKITPVAAWLSSTYNQNCAADRCIDEDHGTSANCNKAHTSMCHSARRDNQWLQIDLGSEYLVTHILVYNRLDGNLESRLYPFEVWAHSSNRSEGDVTYPPPGAMIASMAHEPADATKGAPLVLWGAEARARYISLVLPGALRTLNLQEVAVYGTPTSSPPPSPPSAPPTGWFGACPTARKPASRRARATASTARSTLFDLMSCRAKTTRRAWKPR